ncbi:MAG: RloB family protein [Acidimicrobiaceae bacterium]|nr:RloB family protein [Acidimicrobiaceae bacterium]
MPSRHRKTRVLAPRATPNRQAQAIRYFLRGRANRTQIPEGSRTVEQVRQHAVLEVRGKGYDPHRLVAEAKQARRDEHADEEAVTEYWRVFDVEAPTQHPRLHDANSDGTGQHISVAISNPCFELWLILQHQDHTRPIDNRQARSILRKHDASPAKGLDSRSYMQSRKGAVDRARQLAERHNSAGYTSPPKTTLPRCLSPDRSCRGTRLPNCACPAFIASKSLS